MSNIYPDWPAPANVIALTTGRTLDSNPFDMSLPAHRHRLKNYFSFVREPQWLIQTHSDTCVVVDEEYNRQADAAITRTKQCPLAIVTADCLPILLCNESGTEIAAIHAGWRGLAQGIIENTLNKMQSAPSRLHAWLGPAICHQCFEVGEEVKLTFENRYGFATSSFRAKENKWLGNLSQLATDIFASAGVLSISRSNTCTFEQINDYYSYRREGQTGRMASLIWFK